MSGDLLRRSRRAAHRTIGTAVAATVLGQVTYQPVHYGEIDRIKELTAFASLRDEARPLEILQVERQR